MQSSLSWIEWFDRLDRVLNGAREDVRTLVNSEAPNARAVVERCGRQIAALTDHLRLLDRRVLAPQPGAPNADRAYNLQRALDNTVHHLDVAAAAPESQAARERLLTVDSALRDSCHEAAVLLGPAKLRA